MPGYPRRALLASCLALLGCGEKPAPRPRRSFSPLGEKAAWQLVDDIPHTGSYELAEDELRILAGQPITAVRYTGWQEQQMPVVDYEISFQAQRISGTDFFCALTFPVRQLTDCCTFVMGAWGGGLCGISNIDDRDANENTTRSEHRFEDRRWYAIRIEVRADYLQVWKDGLRIVNAFIEGHKISMRPGEIEACAPFGLASYWTSGAVRQLRVTEL